MSFLATNTTCHCYSLGYGRFPLLHQLNDEESNLISWEHLILGKLNLLSNWSCGVGLFAQTNYTASSNPSQFFLSALNEGLSDRFQV